MVDGAVVSALRCAVVERTNLVSHDYESVRVLHEREINRNRPQQSPVEADSHIIISEYGARVGV